MSTSFSANQYQNAFQPKRLSNWEEAAVHPERPRPMQGYTKIIGNDQGHLVQGIPSSTKNPWGDFVGTWDMPRPIPGNCATVSTARTNRAQQSLQREARDANKVLGGRVKNEARVTMKDTKKNKSKSKAGMNKGASSPSQNQEAVNIAPEPDTEPERPAQAAHTHEAC